LAFQTNKTRTTISEINITPFVDVILVLLIMFMVTAPLMQQGIEVELPKTKSSGVEAPEDPLVLTISSDKKISILQFQLKSSDIHEKIKTIFKTRKNKQIFIQADKKVEYGFVAEVMAEIRSAGIYNISLITIPKDG
jgi:biopolymer transport protein TolR